MEERKERNSGIELLRIVLMLMICILHIVLHGGGLLSQDNIISFAVSRYIKTMCACAVDGYALISGYVATKKNVNTNKLINMWLQGAFYLFVPILVINIRNVVCGINNFDLMAIVKSFMPITNGNWYFGSYFVMLLFTPFVNKAIDDIDEKEGKTIFIFIIACSIFSLFGNVYLNEGYSPLWLLMLYMLGKLIRKLNLFNSLNNFRLIVTYFVLCAITMIMKVKFDVDGFEEYTSPTVLCSAICLLLIFTKLNFRNKAINYIGSLTFGAYLFHDNVNVREFFIADRFTYIKNPIELLVAGVLVFVVSLAVEAIRKLLFKLFKANNLVIKIEEVLSEFLSSLTRIM